MLEKSKKFLIPDWPQWKTEEEIEELLKMEGIVDRVMTDRRFGFIKGYNKSYFFHADDCPHGNFSKMAKGVRVSFTNVDYTPKGPRAQNVVMLFIEEQ